jgi:hypothetical protein
MMITTSVTAVNQSVQPSGAHDEHVGHNLNLMSSSS